MTHFKKRIIMKNILKLLILSTIFSLTSCEDFLDRPPLDEISELDFFDNSDNLRTAVNGFYNDLPNWSSLNVGFNILPDSNTDIQPLVLVLVQVLHGVGLKLEKQTFL